MSSFGIGVPTLEHRGKSRRFLNVYSDPFFSIFCILASIFINSITVFHELGSWYIQVLHKVLDRYCLSPKEARGYFSLQGIMWPSDNKWSLWFCDVDTSWMKRWRGLEALVIAVSI